MAPEEEKEGILVFEADGRMVAVSFVDAPVPDGEAEHYAQGNYLWPEAVEVTKTHVSQLILAVFSRVPPRLIAAGCTPSWRRAV